MKEGLVLFRLGNERYGLPLACVRELARVPKVTAVPRAPSFVAGVANLRGNVLGLIDLRAVMGTPGAPDLDSSRRRMMVLQIDGVMTGVLVDMVEGVSDFDGELDPPVPTLPDSFRPYVRGHLPADGSTIAVLEPSLVAALKERASAESG